MRTLAITTVFVITATVSAETIKVCPVGPYNPNKNPDPGCDPVITFTHTASRPPFDAPVRYVRTYWQNGHEYWVYAKAGEPSRPCTTAEAVKDRVFAAACAAKIGDGLYAINAFRVVE